MEITKEIANNKALLLQYFRNRSKEFLAKVNGEYGNSEYKKKAKNRQSRIRSEKLSHAIFIAEERRLQKLSEDRALAVYKYLVDNGIEKERLKWKGFSYSRFHR